MPNFINPYNFVRCGKPSLRKPYVSVRRFHGLSGTITCELKTITPIFIGGPREGDNQRIRFFKINGEPAIPATSLKGVIRSVAEAASNSCFSIFDDQHIIYRDVPERSKRAGVMRQNANGDWFIDEVEEIVVKNIDLQRMLGQKPSHGLQVRFNAEPGGTYGRRRVVRVAPANSGSCSEEGTLRRYDRGLPPNVISQGYRVAKSSSVSYQVQPEIRQKYKVVIEAIVDPITPEQEKRRWQSCLMDLNGAFVYFQPDKQQVKSFGKNRRYKWVREYSTRQLLERIHDGGFLPCTSRQQLCFCCRLFGTVGEGENQQVAGRVMLEDALIQASYPQLQQVVLRILGSPKPKYHPFYVTTGRRAAPKGLASYDDADSQLRGRKFYWHHPTDSNYQREPNQRLGNQNVQVELLPAEAMFTFKVRFTNLEEVELGLLLYALCLNDNDPDGTVAHKLGMGKPIGLGSAKITVTDLQAHRDADRWRPMASAPNNNIAHYIGIFQTHLQQENDGLSFDQIPNIVDLKDVLTTQALAASIEYPPPYGEGFRWFMKEKRQGYRQPLPCTKQTRDENKTLKDH
ncbi:MAG TPA: TIGR03986 family CRISPR-associated RAMP protein [Candidatus Fraserbacteria bacterium]|nr:TIGR03986 family CRISPR-associated RAMP protein [Candidatus Fraserbacteria bacterium]